MLSRIALFVALAALPQERVADRVVAIVNDEPILLSELRQQLPDALMESAQMRELMKTNLTALINQTLILQEVQRLKIFTVEPGEVEAALREVESLFPSREQMERDLRERGMTVEGLQKKLKQWLLVRKFVEYRFRRRAVYEDELKAFYDSREWLSALGIDNQDAPLPPLSQVRDQLEKLLEERRINEELDRWLEQARDNARIIIKF